MDDTTGAVDRIRITGITATGNHGVLEHERQDGQTFVADVALHVDTRPAAESDRLGLTIDYATLAEDVAGVLAGPPVDLIETLAERIAALALERDRVLGVDVVVHKPQAPLSVAFGDVTVEIHRNRRHSPSVTRRAQRHAAPAALPDVVPAGPVDVVPTAAPVTQPVAGPVAEPMLEPMLEPMHEPEAFPDIAAAEFAPVAGQGGAGVGSTGLTSLPVPPVPPVPEPVVAAAPAVAAPVASPVPAVAPLFPPVFAREPVAPELGVEPELDGELGLGFEPDLGAEPELGFEPDLGAEPEAGASRRCGRRGPA